MRALGENARGGLAWLAPKFPDLADLLIVGVIALTLALSLVKGSLLVSGQVLSASILGFALAYLFASRSLRGRRELGVERLFISLCALVSSVWLFEIIWRLWGFDTWNLFPQQLLNLTFSEPFPMAWAFFMVSLVFVGRRYMGLNRWFFVTLALAVATFALWKAVGFPQFPHPEWWPSRNPSINLIPISYSHSAVPAERATIVFWGALLNSVTKVFWCALPGTLFLTRENLGGTLGQRLWPVWPGLRRLFLPWTEWGDGAPAPPTPDAGRLPAEAPVAEAAPEDGPVAAAMGGPSLRCLHTWGVRLAVLLRTRLADAADLFMVAVIVAVVGLAAANHTFVLTGRVLAASIAAYALAYLVASRSLRRCEGVGVERIFMASCAMVSGIWLFELVNHYGWVVSWEKLSASLTDFNVRPPVLNETFPLMWCFIMISVVFVGARYMRLNRWFILVAGLSAATLVVWLAVGYPSFRDPWRSPQPTEVLQLIPPLLAHPKNPAAPGWEFIAFWGAIFIGLAKFLFCMLPATLFLQNLKRGREGAATPPDDILARAWKRVEGRMAGSRSDPAPDALPIYGKVRFISNE